MIINEHWVGKLYKEQKLPFITQKNMFLLLTLVKINNVLLISRAKDTRNKYKYLLPPIDQFVASQFLACGSLWEGTALSQQFEFLTLELKTFTPSIHCCGQLEMYSSRATPDHQMIKLRGEGSQTNILANDTKNYFVQSTDF